MDERWNTYPRMRVVGEGGVVGGCGLAAVSAVRGPSGLGGAPSSCRSCVCGVVRPEEKVGGRAWELPPCYPEGRVPSLSPPLWKAVIDGAGLTPGLCNNRLGWDGVLVEALGPLVPFFWSFFFRGKCKINWSCNSVVFLNMSLSDVPAPTYASLNTLQRPFNHHWGGMWRSATYLFSDYLSD